MIFRISKLIEIILLLSYNVLVSCLSLLVGIYAKHHLLDGKTAVESQLVAGNKGLECFLASEKMLALKASSKKDLYDISHITSHNRLTSVN